MLLHRVAVLQEALDSAGANLRIDGSLGPATEAALKHYQQQNGLQVTGKLDQATWAQLDPIG
jgi:peptidoglycan hydrolase-like protein with peptidoglycan-binding domain